MITLKNGGVSGVPLLNFEADSGVPLLKFEWWSWGSTFKL